MRTDILGVGFHDVTVQQAVEEAYATIDSGSKAYIVTPNPEIVWMARRDADLRETLNNADLVLPDGTGIVLAAKILGTPLKERVPGVDFIAQLFMRLSNSGGSVFLFGAKPGVAEDAARNLAQSYPGLIIAGTADGYIKDDDQIIKKINDASPDLLLVCLGAPKQEFWMAANLSKLNIHLCAGLGGALDLFAGNVKRAPMLFRRLGLEWLYRLAQEPRRIKRMIKIPLFVIVVVMKRISRS